MYSLNFSVVIEDIEGKIHIVYRLTSSHNRYSYRTQLKPSCLKYNGITKKKKKNWHVDMVPRAREIRLQFFITFSLEFWIYFSISLLGITLKWRSWHGNCQECFRFRSANGRISRHLIEDVIPEKSQWVLGYYCCYCCC